MRKGAGLRYFLMAAVVMAAPASVARADEDPGRGVARISLINGDVSVRRGDSGDWVAAAVNAPLVVQDAISTGPGSRAEVQFDNANMIRLGSDAEIRLTELEGRRYQVQVARGTVEFRVLRNSDADVDVSTPAVSVRPQKRGAYRLSVRDDGETEITVRSGEVEVYTPKGVERLGSGHSMLARNGSAGPEFQMVKAIPPDEFDRWNEQRDNALERSASYRYVSPSVYGAEDLDGHGRWVFDQPYGWVWVPNGGPGWAPYSRGRWVWEDWYGWTWVSYDPWGWAPYHYGRWYNSRWGWCWYPGAIGVRHYWSPALVAFFGFGGGGVNVGVGFGFGNVGWVPLAPYETYYPWYGRGYYGGYRGGAYVDRSVHITNVNIYNTYRNARVQNGVSGVDAGAFGRGNHNIIRVSNDQIHSAGLVRGQLPVAPDRSSLRLADREVRNVPRAEGNTQFFSRRQVAPVERVPFAEQQRSFQRVAQQGQAAPSQPAAPAARPANAGGNNNGWRRGAEPAQAGQQVHGGTPAPANNPGRNVDNGWRRPGDGGGRAGSPAARPADAGSAPRSAEPSPRNQPSDSGNWRRFGAPSPRQDSPRPNAAPRPAEQAPRQVEQAPRQVEQPPRREQAPRDQAPNSENQRRNRGDSSDARTWNRFGDPQRSSFVPDANSSQGRGSATIGSPVVRERSTPRMESAPRVERSVPRMERQNYAPAVPRVESAPRASGGGGSPRSEARGNGGGQSHAGRGDGGRGNRSK